MVKTYRELIREPSYRYTIDFLLGGFKNVGYFSVLRRLWPYVRDGNNPELTEAFVHHLREIAYSMHRTLNWVGTLKEDSTLSAYKDSLEQLYAEIIFVEQSFKSASNKKDFSVYPISEEQIGSYIHVIIEILEKLRKKLLP